MAKTFAAIMGLFVGILLPTEFALAQTSSSGMGSPQQGKKVIRKKVRKAVPAPADGSMPPSADPMAPVSGDAMASGSAAGSVAPVSDAANSSGPSGPYKMRLSLTVDLASASSSSASTTNGTTVSADGPSATNFNIKTGIGYLVTPKVEIGFILGIDYESTKITNTSLTTGVKTTSTTGKTQVSIGVNPRYNFSDVNTSKIVPYLGVNAKYIYESTTVDPAPAVKANAPTIYAFGVEVGCHYFLVKHVALTGEINFEMTKSSVTQDSVTTVNSITKIHFLNVGLSTFF